MTESQSPIFYTTAHPEQVSPSPKSEQAKAVSGVRKAVDKWLERIGPKSIENHFIKAHENILATFDNDQRKEIFARETQNWRKTGKILGIAATVIDVGLVGLGTYLSGQRWKDYRWAINTYERVENKMHELAKSNPLLNPAVTFLKELLPDLQRGGMVSKRLRNVTHSMASVPSLGSLGILITSGPGHWLAHLAASGAETIGKMKVKSSKY